MLGSVLANSILDSSFAAVAPEKTVRLTHVDGRRTDYRILMPARAQHLGMVVFSHGLKSSNKAYDRILQPWAIAGFLVAAPNHLDSDPSNTVSRTFIWETRIADVRLAIEKRAAFQTVAQNSGQELYWPGVCAAGHSFGGATAQALAGGYLGENEDQSDRAVSCVIAFSPPGPRPGFIGENAWSTVQVPALLETGTADILPGFDDWRLHKQGFENGSHHNRWLVVGAGVDHYFGGLICKLSNDLEAQTQSPALHATVHITVEFLGAYLKACKPALAALASAAAAGSFSPAITLTRV